MRIKKLFKEFGEMNAISIEGCIIYLTEAVHGEEGRLKIHMKKGTGYKIYYLDEVKSIVFSEENKTKFVTINENDLIECTEAEFFELKSLVEKYWEWNTTSFAEEVEENEEAV